MSKPVKWWIKWYWKAIVANLKQKKEVTNDWKQLKIHHVVYPTKDYEQLNQGQRFKLIENELGNKGVYLRKI